MLIDTIFSVMLCAAGVVFAAHSLPSERKAAISCSSVILIACVAYNAAWWPSPHLLVGIRTTTYFSFISVLAGSYCLEKALHCWWGLPLFGLFILDICCHIARAFNEVDYYPYSVAVDAIGYLQIAIFFIIGGDGVRNRFAATFDRLCYGLHSGKTTSRTES